jgi:hypothetical protein
MSQFCLPVFFKLFQQRSFQKPDRIGSKLHFDKERSTVGINNNELRSRPNLFTVTAVANKSGVVLHEVPKDRFVAERIDAVAC